MTAYCATTDLLTGDIPIPSYLNSQKFVDDAADEIDSNIGFMYVTPVVMVDIPLNRPARLLLKRINAHLATGRLIMAVAAPEEDNALHAYGKSLVDQSLRALARISSGGIKLEGAQYIDTDSFTVGPLSYNKDEESNVDAFYDTIVFNSDPPWLPQTRLPYGPG